MPINYDPEAWKRTFQNYLAAKQLTTGVPVRPEEMGAVALAELQNRSAINEKNAELALKQTQMNMENGTKMAQLQLERDRTKAFTPSPMNTWTSAAGNAMKAAQAAKQFGAFDFLKPSAGDRAVANWNGTEMGTGPGSGQPTGTYTPYTPPDTSATNALTAPDVWGRTPNATSFGENPAYGQDILSLPGEQAAAAEAYAPEIANAATTALTTGSEPMFDAAAYGVSYAAPEAATLTTGMATWPLAVATGTRMAETALMDTNNTSLAGTTLGQTPIFKPFMEYLSPFIGGDATATIVCTELNRQGYLPREVMEKDSEYRKKHIDLDAYHGYLMLFSPIVGAMRRSRLVTTLIRPFGVATAREMASRVDSKIKGSILGKIILKVGIPMCRAWFRHKTRLVAAEVM